MHVWVILLRIGGFLDLGPINRGSQDERKIPYGRIIRTEF